MAKEFTYRGKTADELQKMGLTELAQIMPAKFRRRIKRGLTDGQKKLLEEIKKFKEGKRKKPIKTHYRDLLILPEMFGIKISVHNGKEFIPVEIQPGNGWSRSRRICFDKKRGQAQGSRYRSYEVI